MSATRALAALELKRRASPWQTQRVLRPVGRRHRGHQRQRRRRDRDRAQAQDQIGKVYAGRNGIIGALTEDLIDTSKESARAIAALMRHAGGRVRLVPLQAEERRREPRAVRAADRRVPRARHRLLLLQRRQRLGRHLPEGLADRATLGYPLTAVHVPKTVDNDLAVTDYCPGFGSVAKYVATSMREAAFDVASMAKTSTKVFVLEVMGRHAGWITAAVGLADDAATPIPLVLLFPEIAFDEAKFIAAVDAKIEDVRLLLRRRVRRPAERRRQVHRRAGTRDAFGHAQLGGVGPPIAKLVKDKLGHKYHWAVADYLQRAARHLASKTDLEQSYAVGKAAVEFAVKGMNAVMPAIVRIRTSRTAGRSARRRSTEIANVGEDAAARFHHRGRLRHHRKGARVSRAADRAARRRRRSRTGCRTTCG